jgi:hypothetical protein
MIAEQDAGWGWFEPDDLLSEPAADLGLCLAFARCLAGPDGQAVLQYLKRSVLDRRLPPSATDAELRHLEGQRFAVATIVAMVERGRA